MPWWLHDGQTIVELSVDGRPSDPDTTELSDRELEQVVARAAADVWGIATLRRTYAEAFARGAGGSLHDDFVIAELAAAIVGGRLRGWASAPTARAAPNPAAVATALADTELTDLASLASEPPASPAPVDPSVAHQVEILRAASAAGTSFCEECECTE
ncbi:MAG: hypothetical protein IPK74_30390 [Deltaproteobacteria bacterium]|nr:hypothetical protein [Deltaproteobacteria bacterium]